MHCSSVKRGAGCSRGQPAGAAAAARGGPSGLVLGEAPEGSPQAGPAPSDIPSERGPFVRARVVLRSAGTQSSLPETRSRGSASLAQPGPAQPGRPCSPPAPSPPPYLLASRPPELPQPRHAAPALFWAPTVSFPSRQHHFPYSPRWGRAGRHRPAVSRPRRGHLGGLRAG